MREYKDLEKEFLRRVTKNTRRYVGIHASAIDDLFPKPIEAFHDDDHDILMTRRVDDGNNNADGFDPRQKMPLEIKGC
ncbi:hypothetical protein PVK06_027768 [Gossypium arboreum]|uniref:Uncharacterized protein n=1 Tax=Gossypium arboreum TaxID=29729 RepID=A0ABR0P2I9_GOSAR|nr:hypothetical protein PVK06_027768 [Gossypium arboreum]